MPLILALASALLFGLSTPVSKRLLSGWSPQQLAGLLYLGAAMGVSIPIVFGRRRFFPAQVGKANVGRLLGSILFGGILGPLFLLAGLEIAAASSVSLWLNLEMVATLLLGLLLFREHLGLIGWLGAAFVFSAGLLLSWGEGAAGWRSGAFLSLACLCWGLDNNLTARIDRLDPMQSTFWKGLVAGAVNLGLGLYLGPFPSHLASIPAAFLTGAFSYGASLVLYISAAQNLGATRSQMIFGTAPLFGLFFSYLGLHERFTLFQGAALLFQGVGVFLIFRDRHSHRHQHLTLEHSHSHRHDDGHHTHLHEGLKASLRHAHPHRHEEVVHTHPHWPDLHHRHSHASDGES